MEEIAFILHDILRLNSRCNASVLLRVLFRLLKLQDRQNVFHVGGCPLNCFPFIKLLEENIKQSGTSNGHVLRKLHWVRSASSLPDRDAGTTKEQEGQATGRAFQR